MEVRDEWTASLDTFAVHTDVAYFAPWIKENIKLLGSKACDKNDGS